MRKWILLGALFLGFYANACMHALQNRIFPLGWCNKGWVVLETHLERNFMKSDTAPGSKVKTGWRGIAYYKIYKDASHTVSSTLLDSVKLFDNGNYVVEVQKLVDKALVKAKLQKSFFEVAPQSIYYCDYTCNCSKVQLTFDTIQNQVWLQYPQGKKQEVTVLHKNAFILNQLFEDYFLFNNSGQILTTSLMQSLNVSSVRKFKAGTKELTIVHLGSGERMPISETEYEQGKEYPGSEPFNNLHNSVYHEPLLHHGRGFDFMITE